MRRLALEGLTIRTALVLGFGLTVGLWLYTGYNFTSRIAAVERDAASLGERYMQAQELLATVRGQVLLSSLYVRDALLDTAPGATEAYRTRLDELYGASDRALAEYVPVHGSEAERSQVRRLREEIESFRNTTREVLQQSTRLQTFADVRELLNSRVVPKRETAIRISEELQALNRAAFVQQQAAVTSIHQSAERQTWLRLDIALAGSLAIALLATFYAGRLEGRLRKQSQQDALNTRYLQRLSAQLVTVQEVERRNIARELHDEVGQALTAIKVELAVADRAIKARHGPSGLLNGAQTIADTALHTVRDLSHLLHPAMLDDLGLAAAIEWYVNAFARRHEIKVDFKQQGLAERLPAAVETAAYRIVQEALTNVAKHAHARVCRVTVRRLIDRLDVVIEDDGAGFDSAGMDGAGLRGLGLIGMRERAAELKGVVTVSTAPGEGTRVHAELPLAAPTTEPEFVAEEVVNG